MKWRWLLLIPFLAGFTPVHDSYDTPQSIKDEFTNVYTEGQPIQFKVVQDTPTLNGITNGNVVIVSSGNAASLVFRAGNDIYTLNASCITVRR